MANGILMGALAGFGKGMVDVGKQEAEQASQLERMQAQKQIQIDLERYRADFQEELRQKRGAAIKSAADTRLSGFEGPMREQDRSRILAEEEAKYDGKYGTLHTMDRQDRQDNRQDAAEARRGVHEDRMYEQTKRATDASVAASARAGGADKRAQEEHDIKIGELRTKAGYLEKYRKAFETGDTATATKYAALAGVTGTDKQDSLARIAANYKDMAREATSLGKTDLAKDYLEQADVLNRAALGGRDPAPKKPAEGQKERRPLGSIVFGDVKAQ